MRGFEIKRKARKPKVDKHRLGAEGRHRVVEICEYLISKAPQIHYAQIRPFATEQFKTFAEVKAHLDAGGSIEMDCSEAVTQVYKWAGLENPNGPTYPVGEGYTGSLFAFLKHYFTNTHAHLGAIGIFGVNPTVHTVIVIEEGTDPWLFSHGQESGPLRISLASEAAFHAGQPLTWLDVSHLGK
jgi:hypothetical protein